MDPETYKRIFKKTVDYYSEASTEIMDALYGWTGKWSTLPINRPLTKEDIGRSVMYIPNSGFPKEVGIIHSIPASPIEGVFVSYDSGSTPSITRTKNLVFARREEG